MRRILSLVGLCLSLSCQQALSSKPVNQTEPEEAAKQWTEKLKIPFRGAACTTVDSDGDGYVSCVVSVETGDEPPKYQGLQCAELGTNLAGGCKPDSKNPDVVITTH
jgi:hypothetical protein